MVVKVRKPHIDEADYALDISSGGTSSMSVASAQQKLGYVKASKLGVASGVVKVNGNSKLPVEVLANGLPTVNTVSIGPNTIAFNGEVNTYVITDYSSFETYAVSTTNGVVSIDGDLIHYTPASVGVGGFLVNEEFFSVNVQAIIPTKPTIFAPVDGSTEMGLIVDVICSEFSIMGRQDTHISSHWEVVLVTTPLPQVHQSVEDSVNKTNWSSNTLLEGRTYRFRVRHRGAIYGYSEWSNYVTITTKAKVFPSSEKAILTASDAATNDSFGWSVSLSADGSTVLVGAQGKSSSTGAAYVFTKSGSTWTQQAKLTDSDAAAGDYFGISVSLSSDGSTALVGAPYKSSYIGAAYVFTKSGSVWTQQAKLTASDAATYDYFGYSVSLSADGSTALVGAYAKNTYTGAAYIFTKSGSTWTQQAKLTASDAATSDYFGNSVSLSADGSTVLVGAQGKSSNTGAAYIFTKSGSTWTQQVKLTDSDAASVNSFGYSVSLSADGSTTLVGARGKSSQTGAIYIFARSGLSWVLQVNRTASDAVANDQFGYAVALSADGSTALVGTPYKSSYTGTVYVFG